MTIINENAPAGATNTDQGNENLCTGVSTTDLTLRPAAAGCWALSINGRPALTFNHLYHAAQTMRDIHDDLLDGFAHWAGEFDHITTEYLDLAAQGSVRGNWRKAGADHRVSIGWS